VKIDLSGRTAVVTGSTSGIGKATAVGLAAAGAGVVVNGRKQAAIEAAVRAVGTAVPGAEVRGVAADVGTPARRLALGGWAPGRDGWRNASLATRGCTLRR
jgi:NAD(P)-dependent dehydrogenase (short-subunit alcohol dehydrogenase family)